MTSKPQAPRTKALRAKAAQVKTARKAAAKPATAGKAVRTKTASAGSSREKVRAHRLRQRAKGLRLVQMWLPDTRSPEFAAQAHRASLAIANSEREQDEQAFIDSISWWNSEEAKALANSEPEGWWKEPST